MDASSRRRLTLTIVGSVLGSGVFVPLLGLNVTKYAESKGHDLYLVKYIGPMADAVHTVVSSPPFMVLSALIFGGILFAWLEYLIRRWVVHLAARPSGLWPIRSERRLIAMTLVLICGAVVVVSGILLAFDRDKSAPQLEGGQPASDGVSAPATRLSLKFATANSTGDAAERSNIANWHLLSYTFTGVAIDDGRPTKQRVGAIFVTFEKPLIGDQWRANVRSSEPLRARPVGLTDRSLVINFEGELLNQTLDMEILPSTAPAGAPSPPPPAGGGPKMVGIAIIGAEGTVKDVDVRMTGPGEKHGIIVDGPRSTVSGSTVTMSDTPLSPEPGGIPPKPAKARPPFVAKITSANIFPDPDSSRVDIVVFVEARSSLDRVTLEDWHLQVDVPGQDTLILKGSPVTRTMRWGSIELTPGESLIGQTDVVYEKGTRRGRIVFPTTSLRDPKNFNMDTRFGLSVSLNGERLVFPVVRAGDLGPVVKQP